MSKTHIGKWFTDLDRDNRKSVLMALHSARISLSKESEEHGWLLEVLTRMEEDHHSSSSYSS